jgi:hypothetical protein
MPRNRQRDLVPKPTANPNHDVLPLSQFRLALIKFLKLPMDIGEPALRKELERASPNVLRNYLARVQREAVLEVGDIEDTATMRVLGRGDLTAIM